MWKVLLVISGVVLLGAGYLSYDNQKKLETTRNERIAAKSRLDTLKMQLARTIMELDNTNAAIAKAKEETEKFNADLQVADAKVQENERTVMGLKETLAAAEAKLKKDKDFIHEAGEIKELQKKLDMLAMQIQQGKIEVEALQNKIAEGTIQRDQLNDIGDKLEDLWNDQKAGRITVEFTSTVKRAYNQWGFVVIQGGNDQGVVRRATLDVIRRGQPICKLLVTSVEPAESIAEVIPGSLSPGQTVQEGDMVKKTEQAETPPAETTPAAPGADFMDPATTPATPPATTPATPPTTPATPPTTPATPPTTTPATPPAGGGMEADPFNGGGGAPAPATPPAGGGGMEADPFNGGGAPAPATPPAGGGGTDPFGNPTPAPTPPANGNGGAASGAPPDPFAP